MEEKKGSSGGRMVGSKVSQIANIFQAMTPVKGEGEVSPVEAPKSAETNVTVVRTESHVARFNNARALFEKLGESQLINMICYSEPGFHNVMYIRSHMKSEVVLKRVCKFVWRVPQNYTRR